MDFQDLVLKRQSCRNYLEKKVPREALEKLAELGALAPSACNSQPWKFVIADDERAKTIAPLLQGGGFNKWADQVSSYLILCETPAKLMEGARCDSQHYAQLDLGQAAAYITLGAASMGLATCVVGYFEEPVLKEMYGIPEQIRIRLLIAVGYAREDNIRQKIRKPLEEVVGNNQW